MPGMIGRQLWAYVETCTIVVTVSSSWWQRAGVSVANAESGAEQDGYYMSCSFAGSTDKPVIVSAEQLFMLRIGRFD